MHRYTRRAMRHGNIELEKKMFVGIIIKLLPPNSYIHTYIHVQDPIAPKNIYNHLYIQSNTKKSPKRKNGQPIKPDF